MHCQAARHRLQVEVAEEDAGAKEPNDLVGDAWQSNRPVFRNRFFQNLALARIGAENGTFELARREDEGRLLGVEPDGNLKETVIRMDIGWRLARQEHFVRQRSAQLPDSIECERHRSITEMVDALGPRLVDRIADQGYAVAHRQVPHAAPDIAVQVLDKVLQCPA